MVGWSVGLEVMESSSKSTPWGKSGIVVILHGLPVWKVLSSNHLCLSLPLLILIYTQASRDLFLCFLFRLQRSLQISQTTLRPFYVFCHTSCSREDVKKKLLFEVPIMAQWLTNPSRNHEVAGSIPGLAQWVKEMVLS